MGAVGGPTLSHMRSHGGTRFGSEARSKEDDEAALHNERRLVPPQPVPGPGAYETVSSFGAQTISIKKSEPAGFSFGLSARSNPSELTALTEHFAA